MLWQFSEDDTDFLSVDFVMMFLHALYPSLRLYVGILVNCQFHMCGCWNKLIYIILLPSLLHLLYGVIFLAETAYLVFPFP